MRMLIANLYPVSKNLNARLYIFINMCACANIVYAWIGSEMERDGTRTVKRVRV